MSTFVAFLRGVNLGKRQMKMAELKACCESLGLTAVKTILASGNVRFEAPSDKGLKDRLEAAMLEQFGFPVKVTLRSADDIEKMIASAPFAKLGPDDDVALHVLFAEEKLLPKPDLSPLPGHISVARIDAREIYFVAHRLPNGRYTEGMEKIDKLLPKGALVTMRNWNTIGKLLQ
ncbi:MAG TPA: DUF1697 domain-containing protein [Devosia sp.]|nr:DUF1697 domain-containing protein [Devosia sp.]